MKKYKPTKFMLKSSHYDKQKADYAVNFIECLKHTKGIWAGQNFKLLQAKRLQAIQHRLC